VAIARRRCLRRFLFLVTAAAALALGSPTAGAQTYPARPVRLIVGFTPGGPTDILARLMGQWLTERLGQPFVVDNRPGAGSNIGTEAVVNSAPDGYTLLLISTSAAISATFYDKLSFNLVRDIAPVAGIARVPMAMVVNPSVPATTVAEFIAYAKEKPGRINMASVGNGTTPHMAGELFKMMAGVDMLHVPYRGGAPALTDLIGGRAQVLFEGMPSLVEHVRLGKLRALAVTTGARSPVLPDVPSLAEFLPGYEASVWFGIAAPRNTPADIVERLNGAINAGLADSNLNRRLGELGGTALTGSAADFGTLISHETEKWAQVVRAANPRPE
jgi:tripartite-type tricarboxylate transporter receptor subunit TctC